MALTAKQELFIEEYLRIWNATEAYMLAYNPKRRTTAGANGSRLLEKAEILARIKERLTQSAMSADEVLVRLAEQARADLGDFLDAQGNFDLSAMKRKGLTRLIKKLKVTIPAVGVNQIEVELHDAQAALLSLGKHHRLFVDKGEIAISGNAENEMGSTELSARVASILDEARRRQLAAGVKGATLH